MARTKSAKSSGGAQTWLATQLGISQQRLSKLVNSDGWRFGRGPWTWKQLPAIRAHVNERRALNNATAGAFDEDGKEATDATIEALSKNPERVAKIKLIIERTAKLKLERELLAGGYLKKEDVDANRVAQIHAVRAKMQEIPLRASLLAHKPEPAITAILTEWMKEVCDYFATPQA